MVCGIVSPLLSQVHTQTPEYAENPPSTGMVAPVTKPFMFSSKSNSKVPSKSLASPNLRIGVWAMIICPRSENEPF